MTDLGYSDQPTTPDPRVVAIVGELVDEAYAPLFLDSGDEVDLSELARVVLRAIEREGEAG